MSISVHCSTGPVDSSSGVGPSESVSWSSSTLGGSSTVPVSSGSVPVPGPAASPSAPAEEAATPVPSAAAVSGSFASRPSASGSSGETTTVPVPPPSSAFQATTPPTIRTADRGNAGQRAPGGSRSGPGRGPLLDQRDRRRCPHRLGSLSQGPAHRRAQIQILRGGPLVEVRAGAGRGAGFVPFVRYGMFSVVAHGWITLRRSARPRDTRLFTVPGRTPIASAVSFSDICA